MHAHVHRISLADPDQISRILESLCPFSSTLADYQILYTLEQTQALLALLTPTCPSARVTNSFPWEGLHSQLTRPLSIFLWPSNAQAWPLGRQTCGDVSLPL